MKSSKLCKTNIYKENPNYPTVLGRKNGKNIQQQVFANGHPLDY